MCFAHIVYNREDRECRDDCPAHSSPYWRQLHDERCYRGKRVDHRRGSRYVLVSGYEVGAGKTIAVEPVDP